MANYDVLVIGAGPGGYVAAIRAAQLGNKVGIIDREFLGGVCLNVGCIPSKALLKNAEVAHTLRHRGEEFGFSFDNLKLDYGAAVKRSRQVSERLVKGVEFLMKKNKIDVIMGTAKLTAKDTVSVAPKDGGKAEEHKTKHIIIATGASPMNVPGIEPDGKQVLTYWPAILQEKLPDSVVIVGGGAIGLEFATVWSSYGTKVTLVEMRDRIAPLEDEEVSKELAKQMSKSGIVIKTATKLEKVEKGKSSVKVTVSGKDGQETIEAEQVLLAIGFRPNTKDLGLEQAGVKLGQRGEVLIDDRMATNVPGIWAVGDVTAKLMLAHVGSAMGIICAENIAGVETVKLDYQMMPRATYCHPQVASFGLTEAQAKEAGHHVKVGRFNFQANGKALGLGDYAGWVKLITDERYGEILGAHMIGPEVTELLPELTIAQMAELTASEVARNVHAHPSLTEVLMEVAHAAEGQAIHS